jgi:hypothetical protein
MKTDFEIFVHRLRNLGLTQPHRSQRYKDFVTERVKDPHHILGSVFGLKSTDLCIVPLEHEEHGKIQNEKVTIEQVIEMVKWNWKYIEELEKR